MMERVAWLSGLPKKLVRVLYLFAIMAVCQKGTTPIDAVVVHVVGKIVFCEKMVVHNCRKLRQKEPFVEPLKFGQ